MKLIKGTITTHKNAERYVVNIWAWNQRARTDRKLQIKLQCAVSPQNAIRRERGADILVLKLDISIFRQSSNPVCDLSIIQALCSLAHAELAWLFHEPHTGLDDCVNEYATVML